MNSLGRAGNFALKTLTAAVALLLICAAVALALEIPKLTGRVNDYAGMISPATRNALEQKLKDLEDSDSTQLVILTVPSLEGESMEEFAIKVARSWALGQKGTDNGVMLFVAKKDRKTRIEVGYGLEGVLTDLLAGRIVDNEINPKFKKGDFDAGFTAGVEAITKAVHGEYKAKSGKSAKKSSTNWWTVGLVIVLVITALIGLADKWAGAGAGAIVAPVIGKFAAGLGWIPILALIPAGFILGLIAPYLLRGGFYFGGFGFGGGGGGGGDSFSGGGGDFGGGGASGDW